MCELHGLKAISFIKAFGKNENLVTFPDMDADLLQREVNLHRRIISRNREVV